MDQKIKNRFNLGIINPGDILGGIRGGSTGFISNIIDYIKADRITIYNISRSDAEPWKVKSIRENVDIISIFQVKGDSKFPMRLKAFLNYLRYRNRILKNDIDILYIHAPECCLPFLFFNKRIPIIYHQHGSANPVALSKYKIAKFFLVPYIFEIILQFIYKRANWIIAIDRLCYEKSIKNGGINKTTLLMNAIDTKNFKPNYSLRDDKRNKLNISPDKYVILFVGRLAKTKGPARLLESIEQLKKAGFPFHIYFAGEGSYMQYMKNYVKQKHLQKFVTFLGRIPHNDLPSYYNMADVVVLPSDMEGVPMVVLESLACGTPVVASCVGGIPDIIIDNKTGFLLNDTTPKNICEMLVKAKISEFNRKVISASVSNLSSLKFIEKFEKIVKSIS